MLFTIADISEIKPLPMNDEEECAQILNEVEKNEFQKLIGEEFYEDINNYAYNYTELLEKAKPLMCWLFWSRWSISSQLKPTFSGYEIHTTDYSQIPSTGALKNISQTYREYADYEWSKLKKYLDNNSEQYPLWKQCCANRRTVKNGFSDFYTVRKRY